jgi:probable HAF family extracellular repeat protein
MKALGALRNPWRGTLGRLVLIAFGLFASAVAAAEYRVTDLGTLGGEESEALAMNDGGQVVGWSQAAFSNSYVGYPQHAFLYDSGAMRDLGTLGGCCSHAYGINNRGWVVGRSDIGGGVYHAFLYRDGAMRDLGTLGGLHSCAFDINENGDIIGYSEVPNGGAHAFLYSNGVMRDLGTLGSNLSVAHAINNRGDIVGHSQDAANVVHGFLYRHGTMTDIGPSAYAYDIADDGTVVGVANFPATISGNPRAYRYDGAFHDLGTLGGNYSEARGVNEKGRIVGHSQISGSNYAAFLYEGGTMVDLNALIPPGASLKLRNAHDINEIDSIVGQAIDPNGKSRAFLLTRKLEVSPWFMGYKALALNDDDIKLLRQYRDDVLRQSDAGRRCTEALYRHSIDLLKVLLEQPELVAEARELFASNRRNLHDVLQGKQAALSGPEKLVTFLERVAEKSPLELGRQIFAMKNELIQRLATDSEFLGFTLAE